jgi:zinc transporter 2
LAVHIALQGPTKRVSFGYHRVEILGALTSVLLIIVLAGVLVYSAVCRIIRPTGDLNPDYMLYTSLFGLCCNILMALVLKMDDIEPEPKPLKSLQSDPESDVENSKEVQFLKAPKNASKVKANENANVRATFIHILGDIIQSVGVVIASIVIKCRPDWEIVDPICTFIFAIIVSCTTIPIIRDCVMVLLEAVPENIDIDALRKDLESVSHAKGIHQLHVWSLTDGKPALMAHVYAEKYFENQVLRDATVVCRNYGVYLTTIQVEDSDHHNEEKQGYFISCKNNVC